MGRLRHARNQQYHAASRENLCQRGTLSGHLLPVRRGLRSQLQRQEGQVSVAGRYRSPAPVASAACFFCTHLCRIAAWSSERGAEGYGSAPPAFPNNGFRGLFIPRQLSCNFFSGSTSIRRLSKCQNPEVVGRRRFRWASSTIKLQSSPAPPKASARESPSGVGRFEVPDRRADSRHGRPVLSLRAAAHQDLSLPLPSEGWLAAGPPISFCLSLCSRFSRCLFFRTAGTTSFDQVPPANP